MHIEEELEQVNRICLFTVCNYERVDVKLLPNIIFQIRNSLSEEKNWLNVGGFTPAEKDVITLFNVIHILKSAVEFAEKIHKSDELIKRLNQ